MQTTDILYIFDEDYREVIDNSEVKPDSWHQREYPPYDGIPCEKVIEDVKNADYITICAGVCDYISYPNDLKAIDEEKLPDKDEITERLKGYLSDGILDGEAFKALKELMSAESDSAKVTASYIMNILEGYTDFSVCYPQIIKTMRELNPDCTIIVIGTFLPDKLTETEDSSVFIYLLNRILDRLNAVMRATAITYGCVYVDTMGIESNWHPTVNGYKQIYNRIISVLNGEIKYSGGISLASKLVGNITGKLMSSPIKLRLGTLCGRLVKINNLIGSIREKLLKI